MWASSRAFLFQEKGVVATTEYCSELQWQIVAGQLISVQ